MDLLESILKQSKKERQGEEKERKQKTKEKKRQGKEKKLNVVAYTCKPSTGVVYGGEEPIPGALWEQVWPTWHVPGQ